MVTKRSWKGSLKGHWKVTNCFPILRALSGDFDMAYNNRPNDRTNNTPNIEPLQILGNQELGNIVDQIAIFMSEEQIAVFTINIV